MKTAQLVSLRARMTGFIPAFLAASAFTAPCGTAQVFNQPFYYQGYDYMTNQTPSGYTWNLFGTPSPGQVQVTAQGLVLDYTSYTMTGGILHDQSVITNVADITGGGIQLDRYLSFTLAPDNLNALAGFTGNYTVELLNFTSAGAFPLDSIENFEIRTSVDNFANPLAGWNSGDDLIDYAAPGVTIAAGATVNGNGTLVTTNAPLEVRLYTYYDSAGGDGIAGKSAITNDWLRFNYRITATPIPEPSCATLLLGAAGVLSVRRRRA